MMLLHGCLFFRLYKTLYLSSQVKCSRTRARAIGTDLLVDISIHASGTNQALPKVTISSVTLQKKMRAEHMQYHSIAAEWTDFVSMPNCQGHWELCEEGCEQSSDSTDVASKRGLSVMWRNFSSRSHCSKIRDTSCFLWKTGNQCTEHEKLKFTGATPCILICQVSCPCSDNYTSCTSPTCTQNSSKCWIQWIHQCKCLYKTF